MKRFVSVTAAVAALALVAGAAYAQMGPGPGSGMGPGMGPGMGMGPGRAWGPGACAGGAVDTTAQITEEKAKEVAQQYVEKYLKGFAVERVLPTTGMRHTMYVVELKGPAGEARTLHVNPWGGVRPFGPRTQVQ